MKKEIVILGDIELGAGNITDDFISDKTLSQLILKLSKKSHPIDLILNGDTLDFIKTPVMFEGKMRDRFPRHITQESSLQKLKNIYYAHQRVFQAWKEFARKKENNIYFIIGNHDYDLLFKGIRAEIKRLLEAHKNIHFEMHYKQHGVYAQHGQQYDFMHSINLNNLWLKFKKKKLLNMPWMFGAFNGMMFLKEQHPFLERVNPRPVLTKFVQKVNKKINWETIKYFLKTIFYYPIRYIRDPTYRWPWELFSKFYNSIKNVQWDMDDIISVFKRKNKKKMHHSKIYVFGHVHKTYLEEKGNWVILHPDTWRDEYMLNPETKKLTAKPKRYVRIEVDDELKWELVKVDIPRSEFDLDDVLKDEIAFVRKAAAEEGYTLLF